MGHPFGPTVIQWFPRIFGEFVSRRHSTSPCWCHGIPAPCTYSHHFLINRCNGGIVFLVYLIVNNKRYVGITNQTMERRMARCRARSQVPRPRWLIHRAIKKYGWDAFHVNIIDTTDTVEVAKQKEQFHIAEQHAFVVDYPDRGYNMTRGGEGVWGYKHTKSAKDRIREFHTGRKRSTQTKAAIRASKVGKPRPQHVQHILEMCRKQHCGERARGANNPNAKVWKATDTLTGQVVLIADFKDWCVNQGWKVTSAYSAACTGNLYKRRWRLERYSPTDVDVSLNPNSL